MNGKVCFKMIFKKCDNYLDRWLFLVLWVDEFKGTTLNVKEFGGGGRVVAKTKNQALQFTIFFTISSSKSEPEIELKRDWRQKT